MLDELKKLLNERKGEDLVKEGLVTLQQLHEVEAMQIGMPIFTDLLKCEFPKERIKQVPYAFAKKHKVLPISETNNILTVAIADPLNIDAIEELRLMLKMGIEAVYCPEEPLLHGINECYHHDEGAASQLLAHMSDSAKDLTSDVHFIEDLLDVSEQAPIIKLLNLVMTEAIQQGASDIHFEPFEDDLRIRYRIDGILQKRHTPPREYQSSLLTRLKVMAKLDIAEHRLPQDGRIKMKMGGREIDFRVSTIPASGSERIVLRILDKGNVILGLDQIGMPLEVLKQFQKLIHHPEGILLVTGPTGSGKTTTLYSAICQIDAQEINIMTIEDPVEYKLKGIAQIGVQPKIKLDFATGLRHILRQDPDVIMIGEIRDAETAEIAIQASLTGHLVLSTLHTNDAPSAITRLVDMGVEPYLLSSSIIGILAQRLVRKICSHCKETYMPIKEELDEVQLKDWAQPLYRGKGCPTCFDTGYKGRCGIYELMVVNAHIKKQIVKSADAADLRQIAEDTGMKSLRIHGTHLVKQGITTINEVLRVTRLI
ncbi:MAG: type II secretion system ATPase GspE [Parachlamydiales bacterium]|nr:type II secretion system ATPase GspE [Parachlamydiales bacterium]